MDKAEAEKSCSSDDSSQLGRNRSFKSKQLVRSQAIRESQSPPRTASPAGVRPDNVAAVKESGETRASETDVSSHGSDDRCSVNSERNEDGTKRHQVEIQITGGAWDVEPQSEQRQRTKRWLVNKQQSSRDLLSNNPRVACVCGACNACPHCRGRRRRLACPTKQDSGIVCSDDCPDCSDSETTGNVSTEGARKTNSLDVDDQTPFCRCPERKEKPKSISLSRTDSDEKSEPTGAELVNFIKETLNKNARDRMTLLKIEKELHALINDKGRCIVRFPVMTSYGRMLVHRCASLFQLSHHLDQTNKTSVLVSKSGTSGGRIPCTNFKQWCTVTFPPSPQRQPPDSMLAKSILKRATHSLDEPGAGALNAARSKSLEQREREYERVRRRIFSSDICTQDESQWPWLTSGTVKVLAPEAGKNKLLKVQSLESSHPSQSRGRGAVSKSHSFGGYAGAEPPQPRLLSRQGDLASSSWRLSPSSSGYRTLSLHSTDSVTPSPTGGASPEPSMVTEGGGVVWCVTDMSAVPAGAVVIHPQTGRPLTNPDGSVYHFDPTNPPVIYDPSIYNQNDQKAPVDHNNDKRRGRLEKQRSFIDSECECQGPDDHRSKCCCDYRRHDGCPHRNAVDKNNVQSEPKPTQKPSSPCKNRYDSNIEPPHHSTPQDTSTNHRQPYDTNQKPVLEPTNQRPVYDQSYSTNQRASYEARQCEPSNQRTFERPQSYDSSQKYESTNQRAASENSANHRPAKLTNQDSQEFYLPQQSYAQGYRFEEIASPQANINPTFLQADLSGLHAMAQAKVTPVPGHDPNMRPISLTNMMYPTPIPQTYPFVNRMDPPLQHGLYQPMVQAQPEDQKHLASSTHTAESTFRIDPSYPYPPVDYAAQAQCGVCADGCAEHAPAGIQHHRSYNMGYGQVEVPQPVLQPGYQMNNVLLPQHLQQQIQAYPYQEQLQWQNIQPLVPMPAVAAPQQHKLYLHELCPIMPCTNVYPPYNVMYPQVIPQTYPVCQPLYPVMEKQHPQETQQRRNSTAGSHRQSKRNSISGSSRNTPLTTTLDDVKKVPYDDSSPHSVQQLPLSRQNSNEIAVKIQQIKDQMAALNCAGRGGEERRRNSGHGILGQYQPSAGLNRVMGRPANDETQLTSAARAIVNSIRNMHKNSYHQEPRATTYHRTDRDRPDYRRRTEPDRTERPDNRTEKPDERDDRRDRRVPTSLQYRPPYLLRQMSPGTWCRRSPGPIHPVLNAPRRPNPDSRNQRR